MDPIIIVGLVAAIVIFKIFSSKGNLKSSDAKKIIQEGGKVIDVRSAGEFKGGHYQNSINIPHTSITSGIKKLKVNKDTPLILYCASGMRSNVATSTLKSEGYTRVYNAGTLSKLNSLLR